MKLLTQQAKHHYIGWIQSMTRQQSNYYQIPIINFFYKLLYAGFYIKYNNEY